MDPASTVLKILAVLMLTGVNALFVAAEHSLIAARRGRLEPLARAGDRRAQQVLATLDDPGDYISAAQLGITLSSIGLGYIAETTLAAALRPGVTALFADYALPSSAAVAAAHATATAFTILLIAYLHVVLGELVPRMLALHRPEAVALRAARPTRALALLLRPLLRLMKRSAALLVRGFGVTAPQLHVPAGAPDELWLRADIPDGDPSATEQEKMLQGVFQFRDTLAREVMTPRRDIIALPLDATREETLALIAAEGHSRIPVYRESIDDIVGVLLVKDLLPYQAPPAGTAPFALGRLVREAYFVPDTKRIGELFTELRTRAAHMAVVLDEFGGTEGIVTLEDMLEEIVGDIYDEHDEPVATDFAVTETGEVLIDGGANVFDVNERFGLALPEGDYDTIGGFVFGALGRVPEAGDIVPLNAAGTLLVDAVEERRVTRVRLVPPGDAVDPAPDVG